MKDLIIDSHVHIGIIDVGENGGEVDADRLVELADRMGVDKIFVTNTWECFYDMYQGNMRVVEAMNQYPERILGYVTIPSSRFRREAIEVLERFVEDYGMQGLKMLHVYNMLSTVGQIHELRFSLNEPWTYPLLEKAAELKIPALLHCTPEECKGLAEAVPDAIIIMAHMGFGNWNKAIMVAEEYENIFLDTASSCVDMGMIETAVEVIGAERLLYGSDTPILNPYIQLEKVRSAEISEGEKRLILGGNMMRILGLSP